MVLAAALQGQYLETTLQLADLVRATLALVFKKSMPDDERLIETKKVLQRTFQALRIEVNNEFGALDRLLAQLPHALAPTPVLRRTRFVRRSTSGAPIRAPVLLNCAGPCALAEHDDTSIAQNGSWRVVHLSLCPFWGFNQGIL